jgi:hypothetical protein
LGRAPFHRIKEIKVCELLSLHGKGESGVCSRELYTPATFEVR